MLRIYSYTTDSGSNVVKRIDEFKMPTSLKNPNALTFTGGATGSYDGSEPETVHIPVIPYKVINENTAARHSHDNKTVLDGITAEKVTKWDSSPDNTVTLYGTWNADNNLVSFNGIPSGSTAYGIIHDALIAGKLPMLCITNSDGDWEAFLHLCRSDSTEYQFSSFETDSSGGPLLGIVWVRADSAGYQCTVP